MRAEVDKKLFTSDDVSKMYEAGILSQDERVELIDGEIIKLNPGRRHSACCDRGNLVLQQAIGGRAIVSVQNPLVIDIYNEPKPDIKILKYRDDFYSAVEPTPEHVLLVIEISDTTLRMDRKRKLAHYARSGMPEYWIEDLKHDVLRVSREPEVDDYKICLTLRRGDVISPLCFPDIILKVEDLIG